MFRTSHEPGLFSQRPDHMNKRKRLRKQAERIYRLPTEWIGGVLYFKGTRNPVPLVSSVPKSGRKILGYDGAQPAPKTKEWPDYHRIAAE